MEPALPVLAGHHTLSTEDIAVVLPHGQGRQRLLQFLAAVLPRSFPAPGSKYLVCVMVVMVLVTAAGGASVAFMMMFMLAMFVVVMVMFVLAVLVVMVMVLMLAMIMVVVVVFVVDLLHQLKGQVFYPFHSGENLRSGKLIPRGGENCGLGILGPQENYRSIQLLLVQVLGAGEDNGAGVFHLVVEKLAEVFHVYLSLSGVHNGNEAVQM